ncbi:MAG: hypothetical protein ABH826_04545 [Patescibacteria group bacterium]
MRKKLQKFFQKLALLTWKQKTAVFAFILLAAIFVPSQIAHAQFGGILIDLVGLDPMNTVLTILAVILSVLAQAIGKMIVLTISIIVIPLLGYNNFGDSNIISIGWPLVRDAVNMFVIVILLVIAIKTMLGFGGNKIEWQQQLPRLFLAIVAVNFSRTICVLMIDAGQVVMMTFVNALRDIAAGNFVGLFQLDSFMQVANDVLYYSAGGGTGADAVGYLGSSYLVLILLGLVLATLWILALVFIYRIVILWVLVILSPIAFFMGGIKDVFGAAGGKYGEWWQQFVGAVTLGPIMAFFLWLGLAAASQGSIAASEGFDLGVQADSTYGLLNQIFQVEKLLSLFIGYVIIIAGFKASSSASSALGGFAGSLISEGTGMKLAKGIAGAPIKYGAAPAARLGYRGAVEGGKAIERRTGLVAGLGKEVTRAGGALQGRIGGYTGAIIGGAFGAAGGAVQGVARGVEAQDKKERKETIAGYSDTDLTAKTTALDKPEDIKKMPFEQQKIAIDIVQNLATDKLTQDKVKNELVSAHGKERGEEIFKARRDKAERYLIEHGNEFQADDAANKEKLDKVRKRRVDVVAERVSAGKEKLSDLQDLVKDMTPKDFKEKAMQNELVRQQAQKRITRTYRDADGKEVDVTLWEDIKAGRGGVELDTQKAAETILSARPNHSEALTVADALAAGQLDPSTINKSDFVMNSDPRKLTWGLISSGVSLGGMSPNAKAEFLSQATRLASDADFAKAMNLKPEDIRLSVAAAEVSATGNASAIARANGSLIMPIAEVERMIELRPEIIVHLEPQIALAEAAGGSANETTQAIINAATKQKIEEAAKFALAAGTAAAKTHVREYVSIIERAGLVEADNVKRPSASRSRSSEQIKSLRQKATLVKNQMRP